MNKIILIGDRNSAISKDLCTLLEKYGDALLVTPGSITDYSQSSTKFLICSFSEIMDIDIENSVIIFLSDCKKAKSDRLFNKNNHAVFYNEKFNYHFKSELLTGHTDTCTLMVSSIDDNSVCISVNSPILKINDEYFCPCEIKINKSKIHSVNIKATLLAIAILIVFNIISDTDLEIFL